MSDLMRRVRNLALPLTAGFIVACGGGGPTGTHDGGNPPPPPTGSMTVVSAAVTPSAPYVGDSASVAVAGGVSNGALGPDSVVITSPNANPRVASGGTYNGKVQAGLGTNAVNFTVWGRNSAGTPISSNGSASYTGQQKPVQLNLELYEILGDTLITTPSTLVLSNQAGTLADTITFANGLASTSITPGTYIYNRVQNAATMDADALTFGTNRHNQGCDATARAEFPKFQYSATSVPGTDTLTIPGPMTMHIGRATRTDALWNDTNMATWFYSFDNPTYGNIVPPCTVPMTLGILTGILPNLNFTNTLSNSEVAGWQQFQDSTVSRLGGIYSSIKTAEQSSYPLDTITVQNGQIATGIPGKGLIILGHGSVTFNYPWVTNKGVYYSGDAGINDSVATSSVSVYSEAESEGGALVWGEYKDAVPSDIDGQDITFFVRNRDSNYWKPWDYKREAIQKAFSVPSANRVETASQAGGYVPVYFSFRAPSQ
jgi:hypothetical protein